MNQSRKILGNAFLATAMLGALFLLTELIFQSLGKSICPTEGCRVVSQNARFGDISILLLGLSTFSLLAFLSYSALNRSRTDYEKYINLILVASLAAEGFFVGYLAFRIHMACIICLTTFGFFLILCILRLFSGEKEVAAGFLSFAGVFALFYLILPAGGSIRMPAAELVLFYSQDCKYCTEVREKIEAHKLPVTHLLVNEYSGLLKNIGIEHVPTLFVNKKNHKQLLTGRDAIDQYLFPVLREQTQQNSQPGYAPTAKNIFPPPVVSPPAGSNIAIIPKGSPAPFIIQSLDGGVCAEDKKEDQKCE